MNPAVGCHYFPPGLQLPSQPLRGLLPISLLGEQKHDGCEQFAYPTASRLRFEPRPYCTTAPESSTLTTRLPSHPLWYYYIILLLLYYIQARRNAVFSADSFPFMAQPLNSQVRWRLHAMGNESVPIQLAQCWFSVLAISSAKIQIYISSKIYGSDFIKQHSETVMV